MKYLRHDTTDAHYNMALDEYCLERCPWNEPVFYLWQNAPAVIIGLNQNAYAEVNLPYLESHGIKLARRVTGGGAVYHDLQNLNYTIVGRSSDLDRDFPEYMHLVVNALRTLGVDAELSGRNDILVAGRKVSGYAKRVYKDRLMIHGTLMYDVDIEELTHVLAVPGSKLESAGIASVRSRVANLKTLLPQFSDIDAFRSALQDILAEGDCEVRLTPEQLSEIQDIAREKFSTWEWNYGRSPAAAFRSSRKCACGTVEVQYTVSRGIISSLAFGGDFLGFLPADELAGRLIGCRFSRQALMETLEKEPVGRYFDKLTADGLADIILG